MPTPTLIIGNKNYSSWSLRPWLLLRHFDIDFDERRVPLFTDTTDATLEPYFSDFKVPILLDGERLAWDTLAICEYLSETRLDGAGWPTDVGARAFARSVSAEMHSSFVHLRDALPMNCRKRFSGIALSDDALREIERVKVIWRRCRNEFGATGNWLFGEFSIADAMYAPVALRFDGYAIPLEGIEKAYVDRMLAHPAIVEWMAAGSAETEIIEMDEIQV